MFARAILLIAMAMLPAVAAAQTAGAPLGLEAKIPLGEVSGRIDHLGIDMKRQRLFVAELGNNSLGVVDLAAGKVLRRISGLSEPQGVAYVPFADSVHVANAGDGSVRVLRGDDLAPIGRVELGDDADNVRVDAPRNRVLVGYGKGATLRRIVFSSSFAVRRLSVSGFHAWRCRPPSAHAVADTALLGQLEIVTAAGPALAPRAA